VRLSQIEDFLAVVESGGIRAAARKRGVSQPAITRSLRSLESDLGAQLVDRTPRGIVLTSRGRAFFARVRVAHAELRKAEEEAAGATGGGSVNFGVGPVAGMLVVPEAVREFRRQYPAAQIRILEGFGGQLAPLVKDGTLDFAIGARQHVKADSALSFKPLFVHQLVVAARKGHPLRRARSLGNLAGAEWISLIPQGSDYSPVGRAFEAAGLPAPDHAIQCESYHVLVALLTGSDMLGILTSRLLSIPLAGDLLEVIPVKETLPAYPTYLMARAGIPLSRTAGSMAKAMLVAARRLAKTA
jgi:LysR family transcriptional regulator, regulator of abg operon